MSVLIPVIAGSLLAAGLTTVAAATEDGDLTIPVPPVVTAEREQLAEAGTTSAAVKQEPGRVCAEPGARWLRVRFAELTLYGSDKIVLAGRHTLTGKNWPGKAFHTRAFPGRCVTVTPRLADPRSRYTIDAYQSGTQPLTEATVTVAAAGDICGSACNQTAPLVNAMNPTAVVLAGDNAYESGTLSEYNNKYHPNWGAFKSKTRPSPGNHEYQTSGASGYFDYFNGVGNNTGPAGERGKGYYSFDVGDWHFIALNSNIARTATSTQVQWLRNDLTANTKPCTAAYWHHSRFAAGNYSDNTSMTPIFQALYDHKADLVISGHDHNYIRFAPSRPDGTRDPTNGVRQLLIGTGGRTLYGSGGSTVATIERSNYNTFGVGKLTLTATGYTANFVPVAGRTFTDTISGTCHKASAPGTTVYADDFATATGWTANPNGTDTATVGRFERGTPQETVSTYSDQIKQLSGTPGLVTGAAAGSAYGANDLDGGVTSIRSPEIAIPAGTSTLSFGYNVAHGDNSGPDDYLRVSVVDGTTTTKVFEQTGAASEVAGSWRTASVDLSPYAGKSVRLLVSAADAGTGSLFEAQIDDVKIVNV